MSLKEYNKKRDFTRTMEPPGKIKKGDTDLIYVVQKHQATHLHYDLRLELDGVLKSWAVPKGIPKEQKVKRLAVQTEDHPLEYAKFEGEIPQGEYGAGIVEIWDKGFFTPIDISDNKLIIDISGKKVKGHYCLIRFKPIKNQQNWLLFKMK